MPATRPLDSHSNRVGHRAGRGMTTTIGKPREFPLRSFRFVLLVQRRISPLSFFFFLSTFLFSPIEKTQEREERETSRRNRGHRYFVYFRPSRIAEEWFEWRRFFPSVRSFPSLRFSRRMRDIREKLSSPTFLEQVWKVDFWKGREWVKREKFLTVIDSTRKS